MMTSHLEYPSNVFGFAIGLSQPEVDQLEECLTGCHLVLIPARYRGGLV